MQARDYNTEHSDNDERQYAYDIDWIVREYMLQRFSSHIDRSGPSLEIGPYLGDMTEMLLNYVDDLDVIEASPALATALTDRLGTRAMVINADATDWVPSRQYDNIFLVHTLEHISDSVAALRRIGEWLTPGGRLFVAVPNGNALSRLIAVHMGLIPSTVSVTRGEAAQGHCRTYTLDALLGEIRESGLHVHTFGGVMLKALANFQLDSAIDAGIVSRDYLDACDQISRIYPDFASSVYGVCKRAQCQ